MAEHAALYVAGNYAEPAADQPTRPVTSPVTGEHLADLPDATTDQIDRAVARAGAALEDYRHRSAHERAALRHRIAELIDAHADELARLTTLEQGKTLADALDDVTPAMAVAREESFGPILPAISVPDDDELPRIANADPIGLQAAVFTRDLRRAFRFAEGLRVGSVVVNDSTDYFESAQPFGGAAASRTGWGRVGGLAQLRDMTDLRAAIFSLD